jgi:hypothetical protein
MELVPGRECGDCTVCCVVHSFDSPDFQKMPGVACAHLSQDGKGCSIHASRFAACHAYHCAWRFMAGLGEGWRPDRSGVLVDFQTEDLPPQYPKRPGVRLTLVGPRETVFNPAFLDFVRQLVVNEIPAFLAVPGPPGHFPANGFLNDALQSAAEAGDTAQIQAFFSHVLASLEGHVFNPAKLRHGAGS